MEDQNKIFLRGLKRLSDDEASRHRLDRDDVPNNEAAN